MSTSQKQMDPEAIPASKGGKFKERRVESAFKSKGFSVKIFSEM